MSQDKDKSASGEIDSGAEAVDQQVAVNTDVNADAAGDTDKSAQPKVKAAGKARPGKARALRDCIVGGTRYACNTLIEEDSKAVDAAVKAGDADASAPAVRCVSGGK